MNQPDANKIIDDCIHHHAILKKIELELDAHPGRVIQKDDVLNVHIALESTNSVDEFLEKL